MSICWLNGKIGVKFSLVNFDKSCCVSHFCSEQGCQVVSKNVNFKRKFLCFFSSKSEFHCLFDYQGKLCFLLFLFKLLSPGKISPERFVPDLVVLSELCSDLINRLIFCFGNLQGKDIS